MGYNTEFSGILKFTEPITLGQTIVLNLILGEDCRNHPEWDAMGLTWIDLELVKDTRKMLYIGLHWDGAEKTYDLVEKVNLILKLMWKQFPDFGLKGQLKAQGQDANDTWLLTMKNRKAIREEYLVLSSPKTYGVKSELGGFIL